MDFEYKILVGFEHFTVSSVESHLPQIVEVLTLNTSECDIV